MKISFGVHIFCLAISFAIIPVNSELFSSAVRLAELPNTGHQAIEQLKNYVQEQYKNLEEVQKLIKELDGTFKESINDPAKFIQHPINSFLLIKHLTMDLSAILSMLDTTDSLTNLLEQMTSSLVIPDENDYKGIANAFMRVADTHALSPETMRKGEFAPIKPVRPLSVIECFELGRIAFEARNYRLAADWFHESLVHEEKGDLWAEFPRVLAIKYLANSSFHLRDIDSAIKLTEKLIAEDPNNSNLLNDLEFYQKFPSLKEARNETIGEYQGLILRDFTNAKSSERPIYKSLCRGDHPNLDPKRTKNFKCRLITHHPLLKLAPVKVEQILDDPPIQMYYDIITPKQTQRMVDLTKAKLQRAQVVASNFSRTISESRISQLGWIDENLEQELKKISNLVEAAVGLNFKYSETWQVNNYGIGGFYYPHYDYSLEMMPDGLDRTMGLRIATWMFYLEAPKMGGATVFPEIGVRVSPVDRAAAFWYNLLPNGTRDNRTLHGACPVLVGSKWVSNKWIRSYGQEFKRPCEKLQY